MVAAAVPAVAGSEILELGCGAGASSLCLAYRVADCRIIGLEIDPELTALANKNAHANGMHERVRCVEGDILNMPVELRRSFDHVFSNPPFHDGESGEAPSNRARAVALHDRGKLGAWLESGLKRVASGGTLSVIVRADRLSEALTALPNRGISIFPLWPRADEPAKRIILQLRKSSGASLRLLPGLVLHDADGHYTREADGILRGGASLALARPRL
jgi:tRNA1(Val) A37 N6-methylase TrmN6